MMGTLAAGPLFGLAPAWQSSRVVPHDVLKGAGRLNGASTLGGGRRRRNLDFDFAARARGRGAFRRIFMENQRAGRQQDRSLGVFFPFGRVEGGRDRGHEESPNYIRPTAARGLRGGMVMLPSLPRPPASLFESGRRLWQIRLLCGYAAPARAGAELYEPLTSRCNLAISASFSSVERVCKSLILGVRPNRSFYIF